LAPWQLLLGRWPDEDVALRGVEVDVCIARSFSSDNYDESLSPCTSVLKSNIRVERSESNRGTLTTLIYPRTFIATEREGQCRRTMIREIDYEYYTTVTLPGKRGENVINS
jgi:hypothetical protein